MPLDRRFELLAHVVKIATSSVDAAERMNSILVAVHTFYKAKAMALFQQEKPSSPFVLAHAWPKSLLDRDCPDQPLGEGEVGKVALSRRISHVDFSREMKDEVLGRFCRNGQKVTLFPVQDDGRLYAVCLLVLDADQAFDDDDQKIMEMISREMAGTIRNYNLYMEAKKRIAELNVLSDMGRYAVSTIDLDQLLNTVAGISSKLLGAKGGLVRILARNGRNQDIIAEFGEVPALFTQKLVEEELKSSSPSFPGTQAREEGASRQVLSVPLTFKGPHLGRLFVFDKAIHEKGSAVPGFTMEDHNLLVTMGAMASSALENALTVQRIEDLAQHNEEMVQYLGAIFEISTVLMNTVDFTETVQIVLHAVIHPAGLDHDHVLLWLVDEQAGLLMPVAEMDKAYFPAQTKELGRILNEVKHAISEGKLEPSERFLGMKLPLDPENNIISRTVARESAIVVENPSPDMGVSSELIAMLGAENFVTIPMFAKSKVVGVLLVTNAISKRKFGDRDIKFLSMLGHLGGLSVENSRLYQSLEKANRELAYMRNRLLEADKLAALGEIAAGVAHEIRNPLVSIGGFTRRIRKKVGDSTDITPYLDVIIEEVTRLESTLNEMLDFSSEARDHFSEYDLNKIMDEALDLLQRELGELSIEVVKKYAHDLPPVYCDDRQIKHVFFNLYLNAVQAMDSGGRLTLRTFAVMREGKQFVAGETTDTGGGIAMDVIHNIFNPFFTTKANGSGLGLSIVHKIVTRHYGYVEVHNREGEGASFLVTLPAAEEGRAYLK